MVNKICDTPMYINSPGMKNSIQLSIIIDVLIRFENDEISAEDAAFEIQQKITDSFLPN